MRPARTSARRGDGLWHRHVCAEGERQFCWCSGGGCPEVVLADGEVPAAAEDAREGAMDVDEEDAEAAGALRVMPREPLTMEASPDMLTGEQS